MKKNYILAFCLLCLDIRSTRKLSDSRVVLTIDEVIFINRLLFNSVFPMGTSENVSFLHLFKKDITYSNSSNQRAKPKNLIGNWG